MTSVNQNNETVTNSLQRFAVAYQEAEDFIKKAEIDTKTRYSAVP